MRTWIGLGLAACVCAAVTSGERAQAQSKPAPLDSRKPLDQKVVIYTKDAPPAAPKLADLPLKDSVSQWGITWTFDRPTPVGQFVNGDCYVIGPVTITGIDPKPLHGEEVPESELDGTDKGQPVKKHLRNGSMLNPKAQMKMACDSGIMGDWFDASLDAPLPIAMKPGDSLVSTVSLKLHEKVSAKNGSYYSGNERGSGEACPLKTAAVLTCVSEPLAADAFRPSYGDLQHTIYYSHNLRRDLLPHLPRVARDAPDPAKFAAAFQRVWFNLCLFGFDAPGENMPNYGQQIGQYGSNAGLLLCLDFSPEEKEPLLLDFVQVGIDYWGLVKNGHPGWYAVGGHGSGRKFPIVFAGSMLGDEAMASPTKSFPKVEFGEDNQTCYATSWTGAKVIWAGHNGILNATGQPRNQDKGPYEQLPPALWDKGGAWNFGAETYRRANTSSCWVGGALAMRLLKLEKQWNHDSFFDYVDRWMYEDDRDIRKETYKYFKDEGLVNETKTWYHQGFTGLGGEWIKPVWEKYRTAAGMPPVDYKRKVDDQGAVTTGPNREFIVNGKQLFPVMLFAQTQTEIADALAIGANTVFMNAGGTTVWPFHYGKEFMEKTAENGLYGVSVADSDVFGHPRLLGVTYVDLPDCPPATPPGVPPTPQRMNVEPKGSELSGPCRSMFDGKTREWGAFFQPLEGAKVTVTLENPVTVSSLAVWAMAGRDLPCAKEMIFSADGKEILKAELKEQKGKQEFKLEKPVRFKELSFRVVSVHPGEATFGFISQIEAFDDKGRQIWLYDYDHYPTEKMEDIYSWTKLGLFTDHGDWLSSAGIDA